MPWQTDSLSQLLFSIAGIFNYNRDFSFVQTRMHSSRMRTVRSSDRIPGGWGWGGVPGPGGYLVPEGMYLVLGGVPGPRGVYLVLGGVPGPRAVPGLGGVPGPGGVSGLGGVYLVPGGVPGPRGCTWSQGVYLVPGGVPGPRGCTWSGGYLVPGGVPGAGGVYLVRYSPSPVDRHSPVKP